ncbi:hypothetical protein MWG02_03710 [Fusobacterium necrophorum]|uniref:hypothetical protein n=1 Tax=Fusobacterium TaxID=848 RepID=UPI00254FE650|nr:hypothetical protein [Fusobacterium necrophorum]MDK4494992.1 hypothetical protein [Fusobacterium necrophorum]
MGTIMLKACDRKIYNLRKRISNLEKKKYLTIIQENKIARKIRDHKLLQLGLLFEITYTLIYSEYEVTGHLLQLKEKQEEELNILQTEGNSIFSEISIEEHDKEEVRYLLTEERKARNHILISYGALLESTNTMYYPLSVLIAYIRNIHNYTKEELKSLEEIGRQFFREKYGKGEN